MERWPGFNAPFRHTLHVGCHSPAGCLDPALARRTLAISSVRAECDHPLPDVHTVVLADPNFDALAYYALPQLFNVIMSYHASGVEMGNILDNLDDFTRVACTVPGLQTSGILHQVLALARGLPPFRAMLHIWTRSHCGLALRLDHLVHVAVPPGQEDEVNHRFRRKVAGLAIQSMTAYCLQRMSSTPRSWYTETQGHDLTLTDMCRSITISAEGLVDCAQTLEHLHRCLSAWPRCHLPHAATVANAVALGRDGDLDVAWLSFLHIYDTVSTLMRTHLTDLARAFDVDFAVNTQWGGCWDIATHLGLPAAPRDPADPLDVRPFLCNDLSDSSAAVSAGTACSRSSRAEAAEVSDVDLPSGYEFESVPDSA